ncbi:hypothetical protein REPUB_Repub12eG0074200 [Reevesia pubescens]
MDVLHWDGTLSAKDFKTGAVSFAQKWETLNLAFPPWSWIPCPKDPWLPSPEEEGYLSLEKLCISRPNEEDIDQNSQIDTVEEETSCSGKDDVIDDATLDDRCSVMEGCALRKLTQDGRPLSLDEIEKELPSCCSKELSKSKWAFITQEEHPYLRRAWYKLHPCGTAEWTKLLFLGDTAQHRFEVVLELYLLSWFSVVGQVFGLRIPFNLLNES